MTESRSEVVQHPRVSPLLEAQTAANGLTGERFGWQMAESYGDPSREHRLVRTSAGLLDLTWNGAIVVGGKESIQFLNGLVTNDVKSLKRGQGMRAAFLTGHGKVRALCRILNLGDEFLIINDPQTHESVYKYVFPFSYAGDFKVREASDDYRIVSVQGPNAVKVMKEICFEPVPFLDLHGWTDTIIGGHHIKLVRSSHTGENGFDILVPAAGVRDVWDFVLLKGAFHSLGPVGFRALDVLRIEAGIPVYGIDADESNMMLELGLTDAVSFSKGCYTGQEAVAMATYRGHISKKSSGLVLAGDAVPTPGSLIFKEDKQVGHVTSAIVSPTIGSVIALAYIKYGFFETSSKLRVQIGDSNNVEATVVDLPFYKSPETAP